MSFSKRPSVFGFVSIRAAVFSETADLSEGMEHLISCKKSPPTTYQNFQLTA